MGSALASSAVPRTLRQPQRRAPSTEESLAPSAAGTAAAFEAERKTIQKLRLRILPFVLLLFVVALIDRNNIGLAALTMNQELAS